MNSIELNAPAKINLYLDVLKRRKDSYHNISTIFCRVNLFDRITIKPQKKDISISCINKKFLSNNKNLAYKAAMLMKQAFGIDSGIKIIIKKNIPIAAGLGGGSSDAASVMLGMKQLFKINAPKQALMPLARQIGADLGFFISGYSCALGSGIGDRIKPIPMPSSAHILLLVPPIDIYTKTIYNRLSLGLTKPYADVNILARILISKDWKCRIADYLYNKLEDVVLPLYPITAEGKQAMLKFTDRVLLSGSGPTIFGVFNTRKEAVLACGALKKMNKWRLFLTKSI
jgi:4-diphosphocytidyl-2-C-methyl-D-erythritol kinase